VLVCKLPVSSTSYDGHKNHTLRSAFCTISLSAIIANTLQNLILIKNVICYMIPSGMHYLACYKSSTWKEGFADGSKILTK